LDPNSNIEFSPIFYTFCKIFLRDVQKSACYINESSIGARGRLQQSDHKGVISAGTDKSQKMVVFDLISIAVFTRDDENH